MRKTVFEFYNRTLDELIDYIIECHINGQKSEAKKVFNEIKEECSYIGSPDFKAVSQLFEEKEQTFIFLLYDKTMTSNSFV